VTFFFYYITNPILQKQSYVAPKKQMC